MSFAFAGRELPANFELVRVQRNDCVLDFSQVAGRIEGEGEGFVL